MKQNLVYFGLFLTFAASMLSARYLDNYSGNYAACAEIWESSLVRVGGDSVLADQLREKIENGGMILNGSVCPELLPDHAQLLRGRLQLTDRPVEPLLSRLR